MYYNVFFNIIFNKLLNCVGKKSWFFKQIFLVFTFNIKFLS